MTVPSHNHFPFARHALEVLILVLCVSCALPARAFNSSPSTDMVQYATRTWQRDEGLPQNIVQSLAQTREGYLWAGTSKGLSRFDGARFIVYDTNNTPELKANNITALRAGSDGTLWIGTWGGGLTRVKAGEFKHFSLSPQNVEAETRSNSVLSIYEAKDSSLWICTLEGLVHWTNGLGIRYTTKDGLLDGVVRSVCEIGDELWIGTRSGLNVLRHGELKSEKELGNLSLRTVMRDTDGNLWVGWVGGIMYRRGGQFMYYTKEDGLADNNVFALFQDRRGQIWAGTSSGLSRYVDGKFTIEKDNDGSFYDQVNTITEDQEGDIWIGSHDGLQQLRVKRFTTYTRKQGLGHNNIMSVMEDRQGDVWIGTYGGGVSRLHDGEIHNYNWENSQTSGLSSDLILGLREDTDGSILIGTDYEGGTYRYNSNKFSRIWTPEQALVDRVIRVIYRDRENNLWFGASPGLILQSTQEHFLKDSAIRAILEDSDGVLWVGTSKGLFCRKNGKFINWSAQEKQLDVSDIALYEDKGKNLWIGTVGSGLARLKNGKLTRYTSAQGLYSDDILEILEDDYGCLWMSCGKGIFRVSKENLDQLDHHKTPAITSIVYGKSDGLETIQCTGVAKPAGWKGRDGRLWFPTSKGLVVTNPNLNRDSNERPPAVLIEEVIADKKILALPSSLAASEKNESQVIRVPAGRGDLEFHFTALSLLAPEKDHFKSKLEGIDADWVEGTRRVADYNSLRPGYYRFRVQACNNDGVWNEAGAMVALELLPHVWQTWWFATATVLLLGLVAGGTARYITRRNLQQQMQRLEHQYEIEQERIRIARDMHDEIGAKLTKISFIGAAAKRKITLPEEAGAQIDKMSQTARDVIRALDEIVWAVNPANDSLEDLATYLCRNAADFFADSPIVCQFNIPPELPSFKLGTHVRHNILLAAKEALNNVLKHSGATNVHIQIGHRDGLFEVVISDNGHGFTATEKLPAAATATSSRVGNGLTNMRQRLETVGGHCQVESSTGKGTIVSITVPLKGNVDE